MKSKPRTISAVIVDGTKIAGPASGLIGALSDAFSPLAPFAPIIFVISLLIFIYFFFFRLRPALKTSDPEEVFGSKNAQIAGFSAITAFVMTFFIGLTNVYADEGGALAANFDGIKNFQQNVLGTLDKISEKQDEIASDVKDIKEIVTGESDIKQLASTEDYTTFEEVNDRTSFSDIKTIAVLYFDNSGGTKPLDPLKKGLADMLISDLSNLKMLRVVEREKLEEIIKELKLNSKDEFDASTRQKVGKLLGAETILFGSFFELMGQFRIDARIIKTETGEIIKSEGVSGETEDFMKLEKQLVWKIARGLDVRFSEKEESIIMASESISYDATLLYASGIELYDNGRKSEALEKFREALALSPDFERAKQMINRLSPA
tara:strand:+ start:2964 stop:4094 length:1131 start_codon:yes stop_codon:yes gene_type:complete